MGISELPSFSPAFMPDAMRLLLTDRAVPDDRSIRFQWIDDVGNSKLAPNFYFCGDAAHRHDKDRDREELSVQVL